MPAVPTYTTEQLAGVLEILSDVDAVELKLTVPSGHRRTVVQRLGIDPLDAVVRQVAFVDTPDLRLSSAGVVVRTRRTQHKPGDLAVKLRPMLPADSPRDLRDTDGFKVELDASPSGYTCSCSLTVEVADRKIKKLLNGSRTVSDLVDGVQRKLLLERMPEGIELADLTVLGPLNLLKCKFRPKGYPRRMVAELWTLPDGTGILELSTKVIPEAAFQAAAEAKVFLAEKGIDLGAPQEMKTRAALAALTADLAGDGERSGD